MKIKKAQAGFTAIEVMVAMTVLTILVGVGVGILLLAVQIGTQSRVLQDVNSAMFSKVQEYENKDFEDIPNGISSNAYEVEDFSDEVVAANPQEITDAEAKVYSEPVSGSLKRVTYKVDYSFGSRSSFMEYATYIQIDGVGR